LKKLFILLLFFSIISSVYCQEEDTVPFYNSCSEFLLAPPCTMDIGLNGYINPAVLAHANNFDTLFVLKAQNPLFTEVNEWGLFFALPGLGFGTLNTRISNDVWITKSRISSGFGSNILSIGFGYEWRSASEETVELDNLLTYGILSRPLSFLSFGLSGYKNLSQYGHEIVLEMGIRPFNSDILTLYSDYALLNTDEWDDILSGTASVGFAARIPSIKGLFLSGRFFPKNMNLSFGLKVSAGYMSGAYQTHLDNSFNFNNYTMSVRSGAREPNPLEQFEKKRYYLHIDLNGYLDYQSQSLFNRTITLLNIIKNIREAETDPTIGGILINTSGFYADREKIWEIRQALSHFKSTGKKVIVYIDYANIDLYFLASIADRIVCDPLGIIQLEGYLIGMSYYKNMLEKTGIGFEELRLYEYKSANESFSRTGMSEAQKKQIEEYLDDLYNYTQKSICEARSLTDTEYDRIINRISRFTPEEALKHRIIDAIEDFGNITEQIKQLEEKNMQLIPPDSLRSRNRPYNTEWGSRRKIAVIYALGICAMDTGITARYLKDDIAAAKDNPFIIAVVLRVDSPGGDALASDVIARAIRECRKVKPVIISQGFVAGSGGYWLSVPGDVIVAGPQTITGSIGVAGGWLYDNGIKDKLGITTDFIKKGKFADLGFGFSIPFINMGLPDRNLNKEERDMLEKYMTSVYDKFKDLVAEGRGMSNEEVEKIAQGRIWSGLKAKENGLIDEIGGLADAIEIAKQKAGIPAREQIDIIEYPEINPFSVYNSIFTSIGLGMTSRQYSMPYYFLDLLKYRIEKNGIALPIIDINALDLLRPYFDAYGKKAK